MNETTPIPRDIPLPLPADETFLQLLLILAFLAHILFVNLMLGSAILTFVFEWKGRREPVFDKLAHELASSITVNKSLAVVLGVAPLLLLNVLYSIHFYTAAARTGTAFMGVIPAVIVAFSLLYLHELGWKRFAPQRGLHLAMLGTAILLFVYVAFVFLADTNLMLFPDRWETRGLWEAVQIPGVVSRFLHFLAASVVMASLFAVWLVNRRTSIFDSETIRRFQRALYRVALYVSSAQFLIGPLVLFTVPTVGLHRSVVGAILLGAAVSIPALYAMWLETRGPLYSPRRLWFIVATLGLTVLCMGTGRHMYRGIALADHRAAMQVRTAQYAAACGQAEWDAETESLRPQDPAEQRVALFRQNCSACHRATEDSVGPSLIEIASLYDSPDGIVTWATAPGRRREGRIQMPAFAALGADNLRLIGEYMIATGRGEAGPAEPPAEGAPTAD